jgi:hypothetical protein
VHHDGISNGGITRPSTSVKPYSRASSPTSRTVPDAVLEHRLPVLEGLLPERRVERLEGERLVTAPGVVDEDVEATVLALHEREQLADLSRIGVVAADRDRPSAGGGDLFGGVVDRPGHGGKAAALQESIVTGSRR